MPTSFCVPQCTKKGYLDENGSKVSHFTLYLVPSVNSTKGRLVISVIRIRASGLNISIRSVVPNSYQKPQLRQIRLNYRKHLIFCLTLLLLLGRTDSQPHCQLARLQITWTTDLCLFQILGKSTPCSNM